MQNMYMVPASSQWPENLVVGAGIALTLLVPVLVQVHSRSQVQQSSQVVLPVNGSDVFRGICSWRVDHVDLVDLHVTSAVSTLASIAWDVDVLGDSGRAPKKLQHILYVLYPLEVSMAGIQHASSTPQPTK